MRSLTSILISVSFIFGLSQLNAQDASVELLRSKYEIVRVDEFENIYLISESNSLLKYDRKLNLLYEYSFNRLGKVTDLDVTNPQKILLFFSDYQIILYLDNTLSEIDRLNLDELGYWNISCVGLAPDNKVWLYDTQNNKLVKIDTKAKELYSSNEFYLEQFVKETKLNILSDQTHTLLYNSSQCLVFDNFGQFIKSLPFENDRIVLKKGLIYILHDNRITVESFKASFEEPAGIRLEEKLKITDFDLFRDGSLYYLTKDGLKKQKLN